MDNHTSSTEALKRLRDEILREDAEMHMKEPELRRKHEEVTRKEQELAKAKKEFDEVNAHVTELKNRQHQNQSKLVVLEQELQRLIHSKK